MLGVSYVHVMTFYVDACALVYFKFRPRSVGRSVDPGTTSRHFGAETKKDFTCKKRRGGKLYHRWIGPYVIEASLGKGLFKLKECQTNKVY